MLLEAHDHIVILRHAVNDLEVRTATSLLPGSNLSPPSPIACERAVLPGFKMCWAFVDSWLLDLDKEAEEVMQRQGSRNQVLPARTAHIHGKKERPRYNAKKAPMAEVAEGKKKERVGLQGMYEYIPAADMKEKKSGRKGESDRKDASSQGNEWMYIPAASVRESERKARNTSSTKVSFAPSAFVCTAASRASTTSLHHITHTSHPPFFHLHRISTPHSTTASHRQSLNHETNWCRYDRRR